MGRRPLNLQGLPCGLVTPEEVVGRDERHQVLWRVVCQCGVRRVMGAHTLVWKPPKTHLACEREQERQLRRAARERRAS